MCSKYYEEDSAAELRRYIAERDDRIAFLEQAVENRDTTIVQLVRVGADLRNDLNSAVNESLALQRDADFAEDDNSDQEEIDRLQEENYGLSDDLEQARETISDLRDEIEALEAAAHKPAKKAKRGRK